MSDDDLIRRGDALRVADEVFDQCQNVHGDDRGAFAAAEVGARIAALAPTDAAHVNETPKSEHDAGNVLTAAQAREAALMEAHKAILAMDTKKDEDLTYNLAVLRAAEKVRRLIDEARILTALAPTDAATQKGGDAHDRRLRSHEASPGVTAGADAAQAREAALMVALHDAVNAPKGVVPDSAVPFWNAAILRAMEGRDG